VQQAAVPKTKASKRKAEEMKRQAKEQDEKNKNISNKWKEGLTKAKIPLKKLPADVEEAALDQLRKCAPLSATNPPSCCMFKIAQVPCTPL
jgi:hypothetical protein